MCARADRGVVNYLRGVDAGLYMHLANQDCLAEFDF